MAGLPAMLQPFTKEITGCDDFAIGHFGSFGYLCAALVGKAVGDKEKSTESINVPKSLGFLRDTSVAVSLTMTILFVIVALSAGPEYIQNELSGGQNFLIFSLMQGITFAAGGKRGAIVGAFVNGLLISFLPALLLPVLGDLGFQGTTFRDSDFGVIGILLGYFSKLFA